MRRVFKLSEKDLRNFINIYLRYHPDASDDEKRNMGIHVAGGARTPVNPPDTAPGCEIIRKGPGMPGIIYRHQGAKRAPNLRELPGHGSTTASSTRPHGPGTASGIGVGQPGPHDHHPGRNFYQIVRVCPGNLWFPWSVVIILLFRRMVSNER
jgi:hypothetical protein